MLRRLIPPALLLLVAAGRGGPEAPLHVEQDGIVVIDVESHPPVKGWERETEHAGFTGSCYLTDRGGGTMTFPVFITRPGRYTMLLHNRHDNPRGDLENDAFVRFDEGPFIKCFSSPNKQWTWASRLEYSGSEKVKPEYDLAAGLHTFQIKSRSAGFKIDRVALFLSEGDGGKRAQDLSTPETLGVPPMPELGRVPDAASDWLKGRLGSAIRKLESAAKGRDADAAAQAKTALEGVNAYIAARKSALVATKEIDPLAAAEGLLFFAAGMLKGCDASREFVDTARKWKTEPAAKAEIKARRYLQMIEGQAARIHRTGKVSDANFAKSYARPLAGIRQGLELLRKSYPDTWSRKRAEAIADRYGLD